VTDPPHASQWICGACRSTIGTREQVLGQKYYLTPVEGTHGITGVGLVTG
jgi:hypothetical protein